MGQGQPRVIILTILVVLALTMPHTKFKGHRFIGFGEEVFKGYSKTSGLFEVSGTARFSSNYR